MPSPRAFHRPGRTLFETLCTIRPSQIFTTAQTMVNDGLALHEHPMHCQEFWIEVMEVSQVKLHDDHQHATLHTILEDVPRNILDFRRALIAILTSRNITLHNYTPQPTTSTTLTDPMAQAVENLQGMQIQAQIFQKSIRDQEALLADFARTSAPPIAGPRPVLPSLLAWNGNAHPAPAADYTHIQTELADANRQLDILNTVVYDYETLREQHDDARRKAAAEIADQNKNLANAHLIIDQMRYDSKQDRTEIECLQLQIRKLKAMQRKFATDLKTARLGCEQEVRRRLGVERGLGKAHAQHTGLAVRVAWDAWRKCPQSKLVSSRELDVEHRRRVAMERAVQWARWRHDGLAMRLAFDALRFRHDKTHLEHRRRVAMERAVQWSRWQHDGLLVRVAWRGWTDASYGRFNAGKTWAAQRAKLGVFRMMRVWCQFSRQRTRARAMNRCVAHHTQTRAWQAWSRLEANEQLYATMIAVRLAMARLRRMTRAWRAAGVAGRVARKNRQRAVWRAWDVWQELCAMVREDALRGLADYRTAVLRTSLAVWREDYVRFARDIEWDAQQHFSQALWTVGGMSVPNSMASIVYAQISVEQQSQVQDLVQHILLQHARGLAVGTALQVGFGMDCIDDAARQLVTEHWTVRDGIEAVDAADIVLWLRLAARSQRSQGSGQHRLMCRLLVEQQERRHQQQAEHREQEAQRMHCVRQTFLGE